MKIKIPDPLPIQKSGTRLKLIQPDQNQKKLKTTWIFSEQTSWQPAFQGSGLRLHCGQNAKHLPATLHALPIGAKVPLAQTKIPSHSFNLSKNKKGVLLAKDAC